MEPSSPTTTTSTASPTKPDNELQAPASAAETASIKPITATRGRVDESVKSANDSLMSNETPNQKSTSTVSGDIYS